MSLATLEARTGTRTVSTRGLAYHPCDTQQLRRLGGRMDRAGGRR